MKDYRYSVTLETLVGSKKGTMQLCVEGDTVRGMLNIMQSENPFSGHMVGESCHISGKLKTLVNSVSYNADGRVTENEISFIIVTDKHRLSLTGGAENA